MFRIIDQKVTLHCTHCQAERQATRNTYLAATCDTCGTCNSFQTDEEKEREKHDQPCLTCGKSPAKERDGDGGYFCDWNCMLLDPTS